MPVQITCPSCRGPLQVPEDLFGTRVQCPTCRAIFTAVIERDPVPTVHPVAEPHGEPAPRRHRYADDGGNYDRGWPPRASLRPHRGAAILTLGILSLILSCFPLGIAAWVMGNTDLQAMRGGRMDPSGEGSTQAGRICGMISTIPLMIAGVATVLGVLLAVVTTVVS